MSPGKKQIALSLVAVVMLGLSYPIYVVGVAFNIWQPVTRPSGVSGRAHYIDAFKSAAWFDCSVDRIKDVDVCRVWDPEGKLVAFGNHRLDGENRAAKAAELRFWHVEDYTGHPNLAWIYLFDHRTLVPVNETGQPLQRFEVRIGDSSR